MSQPLLPPRVDNNYQGYRLALWLLGLVAVLKGAMGVNCIFNGRTVAVSADGIPLDSFTPGGAQAVVAFFALWGLSQFLLSVLCALVLIRSRAFAGFMFALLLFEQLGRKAILYFIPVAKTGHPPGALVNLGLLAVMVLGLASSILSRQRR